MSVRVIYECPNVSLSSGLIRGCFGAALGLNTEENENVLRIYGFEGEAGRKGEVATRIIESNHRREVTSE